MPLGRFNLRHDDNLWNLPRRSLVDRGVPVLPSTAAWDELGVGFVGKPRWEEKEASIINSMSSTRIPKVPKA